MKIKPSYVRVPIWSVNYVHLKDYSEQEISMEALGEWMSLKPHLPNEELEIKFFHEILPKIIGKHFEWLDEYEDSKDGNKWDLYDLDKYAN
ncbi:MAG: hypothetical protein ACXAAH_13620 [Promethearchaeota archaeon]|jgi:hypothetical protein